MNLFIIHTSMYINFCISVESVYSNYGWRWPICFVLTFYKWSWFPNNQRTTGTFGGIW